MWVSCIADMRILPPVSSLMIHRCISASRIVSGLRLAMFSALIPSSMLISVFRLVSYSRDVFSCFCIFADVSVPFVLPSYCYRFLLFFGFVRICIIVLHYHFCFV